MSNMSTTTSFSLANLRCDPSAGLAVLLRKRGDIEAKHADIRYARNVAKKKTVCRGWLPTADDWVAGTARSTTDQSVRRFMAPFLSQTTV
jgi:hypothetical protein